MQLPLDLDPACLASSSTSASGPVPSAAGASGSSLELDVFIESSLKLVKGSEYSHRRDLLP